MKTLYDLLGIDPKATQAQIEQGYKQRLDHYLASQGVGKPDEETRRIQMAREAYLLLCSPKRRQAYDQQLRLYQKARAQMASRSSRKFIAWLMVAIIVVVASVYMRKAFQPSPSAHALQLQEQQVRSNAVTIAGEQNDQATTESGQGQVLASGR